jgi:mannobiose 2-epimerase
MIVEEMKKEFKEHVIPFWEGLKDEEHGGFYGFLSYDLQLNPKADKGCILNSRILWFFSNAYAVLGNPEYLTYAEHAFTFLEKHCVDADNGGVFWSLHYDGTPADTTKHTYNQAFSIYALASYYDVCRDERAKELAFSIYHIIEEKCRDVEGYLEAFTREFAPASNEKLSENGVEATRTMNTLLHVFEAYTELYRVTNAPELERNLREILDIFSDKMYNSQLGRQEVFFDKEYHSLIDLYSYGHDIETSWLLDRGLEVLGDDTYKAKFAPITDCLVQQVYERAFDGHSMPMECCQGEVNESRVWWIQAEAVVGFYNAYEKHPEETKYGEAVKALWSYIQEYFVDKREGSEWFGELDKNGRPKEEQPIVEPWKCPYHTGRMCFELVKRDARI